MTDNPKRDFVKRLEGTHLTDADHDEIVLEISSTIRTISGICWMNIPDDVKIERILEMIDYANSILKDASYNERYLRALENWEKENND
jgi:hypothetical protein